MSETDTEGSGRSRTGVKVVLAVVGLVFLTRLFTRYRDRKALHRAPFEGDDVDTEAGGSGDVSFDED